MNITTYQDREEWLKARRGKITGTRVKDIITKRGTAYKIGVYELIAERVAVEPDEEDPMERGTRLEAEAMARFEEETGKKLDTSLVIWTREDDDSIGISPDGFVDETEAVEIKCLSSARHIEALITKEVPSDYKDQMLQYFVVNDNLKELHLLFYDPRIQAKDFFFITTKREDVQEEVEKYLEYEKQVLEFVREKVSELTF